MAETRRQNKIITKGLKVPVTIEDAIEDALIVCLDYGARKYSGILLDTKKRNLPHGLCTRFTNANETNGGMGDGHTEVPATYFRHTYMQHEVKSRDHHIPVKNVQKDKNSRQHIRLRPRQMLCNKCKAMCQETDKGIVPITAVSKQGVKFETDSNTKISPSKEGMRKQPSCQNFRKEFSSNSLKRQASCPNFKDVKNSEGMKRRPSSQTLREDHNNDGFRKRSDCQNLKESMSESMKKGQNLKEETNADGVRRKPSYQKLKEGKDDSVSKLTVKVEKSVDKAQPANTKASPFIKINIGAGTIVNIPPRFHSDEVDGASEKEPESPVRGDTDSSSENSLSSHKKLKKLKIKDIEKERENEDSVMDCFSVDSTDVYHHKKHKRKHKRKHDDEEIKVPEEDSLEKCDENNDNFQYCSSNKQTIISQRPRLLYTWRQNKGLSPRRDIDNTYNIKMSPQQNLDFKPRKEYRLRSREKSVEDINECISSDNSQTSVSESEDNVVLSAESGDDSLMGGYKTSEVNDDNQSCLDENEDDDEEEGPPGGENIEMMRPLMMKIQTRDVTKCIKSDGRTVHVGDIVWGKIKGFPWWPGRVLSITVSSRESGIILRQLAHLAWFGSSTMSHIQCSDLYPFLEEFKLRYNKKKRGPYKMAIKQATIAAQSLTNTHHIDFSEYDL